MKVLLWVVGSWNLIHLLLLLVLSGGWNPKYNRPRHLLDAFESLANIYAFLFHLLRAVLLRAIALATTVVYALLATARFLLNGALILVQVLLPRGAELRKRMGIPLFLTGLMLVLSRVIWQMLGVPGWFHLLAGLGYLAASNLYFTLTHIPLERS